MGSAVIIGASSGIGEALARELHRQGWRLVLLARRLDRLESIRRSLSADTIARRFDVTQPDAATTLSALFEEVGGADLVIVNAGAGHLNRQLSPELDRETLDVNVDAFAALSQAAMRHFLARGRGHLVGVTSIAALHGTGEAAAYAASKAFQSRYLDSLRDLARQGGHPITVTEVQPGFVNTAMMKTERPLSPFVRWLLVASPEKAARQIASAIRRRVTHAYITKRYAPVGFVLRRFTR